MRWLQLWGTALLLLVTRFIVFISLSIRDTGIVDTYFHEDFPYFRDIVEEAFFTSVNACLLLPFIQAPGKSLPPFRFSAPLALSALHFFILASLQSVLHIFIVDKLQAWGRCKAEFSLFLHYYYCRHVMLYSFSGFSFSFLISYALLSEFSSSLCPRLYEIFTFFSYISLIEGGADSAFIDIYF